jgi:hypothetical protein
MAGMETARYAVQWSPFFAIPVAVWFVIWVRAGGSQPLPHAEPEGVVTTIHAGHRVEKRYNGAQTTVTPEAVRTQRVSARE